MRASWAPLCHCYNGTAAEYLPVAINVSPPVRKLAGQILCFLRSKFACSFVPRRGSANTTCEGRGGIRVPDGSAGCLFSSEVAGRGILKTA
jgi:hypothetical protein